MTRLCLLTLAFTTLFVGYSFSSDLQVPGATKNITEVAVDEKSDRESMPLGQRRQALMLPVTIECYNCIDCPKILPNTTKKLCPVAYALSAPTCVEFTEAYKGSKTYYHRGCAWELGTCAQIYIAHANNDIVRVDNCVECEGYLCNANGAGRSTLSIAVMTGIVFLSTKFL